MTDEPNFFLISKCCYICQYFNPKSNHCPLADKPTYGSYATEPTECGGFELYYELTLHKPVVGQQQGSIIEIDGKKGKKYAIRYSGNLGKRHYKTIGPNKEEAELALRRAQAQVERAKSTSRGRGR